MSDEQRKTPLMADMVTHDLQQPINAILLTTDLLLRSELDDTARERVRRIKSLASRLSGMIVELGKKT